MASNEAGKEAGKASNTAAAAGSASPAAGSTSPAAGNASPLNATFSTTFGKESPSSKVDWKKQSDAILGDAAKHAAAMLKHLDETSKIWASNPPPLSAKVNAAIPPRRRAALIRARSCIEFPGNSVTNTGPGSTIHRDQAVCRTVEASLDKVFCEIGKLQQQAQHALKAKYAYLKVCQRRLDARALRPPQEQFQDILQIALEAERDTLKKERKELEATVKQVEQTYKDLHSTGIKVTRAYGDMTRPVSQMKIDTKPAEANVKTGAEAAPDPKGAPAAAPPANAAPDAKAEKDPQAAPPPPKPETWKELHKRAEKLKDDAWVVVKKTTEKLKSSEKVCFNANLKVSECMAQRAAETHDMRIKLEGQLSALDAAIKSAEDSIHKTACRYGPAAPDSPVHAKGQATETMLANMRTTRAALEEELRCKIAAFKTDDQLRRIVPHLTPVHKNPPTNWNPILSRTMSMGLMSPTNSSANKSGMLSLPTSPAAAGASPPASPPAASSSPLKAAANAVLA